jgi:hypothetical protein
MNGKGPRPAARKVNRPVILTVCQGSLIGLCADYPLAVIEVMAVRQAGIVPTVYTQAGKTKGINTSPTDKATP